METDAQMTFFEAFRFVETYTDSIINLKRAALTIKDHGVDFAKWKREEDAVKSEINKAKVQLSEEKEKEGREKIDREYRTKVEIVKLMDLKKEAQAKIQPTLNELKDVRDKVYSSKIELEDIQKEKEDAVREADITLEGVTSQITLADQRLEDIQKNIELERSTQP